jgi:hypothetical protein
VRDYGLDERGSIPKRDNTRFSSPYRLDRLLSPTRLLSNGYRGKFPGVKEAGT